MSEPFTEEETRRMLEHMNADHADAILLYAQVFGNTPHARAARMSGIEAERMHLTVDIEGQSQALTIPFEKPLVSAHDAHMTLVRMAKTARKRAEREL